MEEHELQNKLSVFERVSGAYCRMQSDIERYSLLNEAITRDSLLQKIHDRLDFELKYGLLELPENTNNPEVMFDLLSAITMPLNDLEQTALDLGKIEKTRERALHRIVKISREKALEMILYTGSVDVLKEILTTKAEDQEDSSTSNSVQELNYELVKKLFISGVLTKEEEKQIEKILIEKGYKTEADLFFNYAMIGKDAQKAIDLNRLESSSPTEYKGQLVSAQLNPELRDEVLSKVFSAINFDRILKLSGLSEYDLDIEFISTLMKKISESNPTDPNIDLDLIHDLGAAKIAINIGRNILMNIICALKCVSDYADLKGDLVTNIIVAVTSRLEIWEFMIDTKQVNAN